MRTISETKLFNSTTRLVNKPIIKSLIYAAGWKSVSDFAQSISLSASGLANILDNRRPHTKEIERIANGLGVTVRRITVKIPAPSHSSPTAIEDTSPQPLAAAAA